MARFLDMIWICAVLALFVPPAPSLAQEDDPSPVEEAEVVVDSPDSPDSPGPREASDIPVVVVRPGDELSDVARSALSGVTAVEVVGRVPEDGGLAHLSLTISLYARGEGPHRIPIGLDGLYPREAVADGVPLGWESAPPDGWFVILPGQSGEEQMRTIRVDVVAPVRSIDERRGLSLTIPRAARRTRLTLDLAGPIAEASLADGSPLPIEPVDDGRDSRIEAMLDARSELEIRWLPRRDEGAPVAPLLTGGGHVAIDLRDGALTAQSTWKIQVRRGEISSLILVPDPDDEVLEVEVEGRAIPPESTADSRGRLLLPLPRAVRKGESVGVSLTTRRPIPPPSSPNALASTRFTGHPFEGLVEQSGTLAIGRTDGLRIFADPERGLRRIDPRDLSEEISRARPMILSAFRFADQPFGLRLRVGPMPPIVRVGQRSMATVEEGGSAAKVECWLDYRAVRGQCFTVRVEVPEGLQVDRVGPAEAVTSWDFLREDEPNGDGNIDEQGGMIGPAILEITFASALREGQPSPLRIELLGKVRFDPGRPGLLPLFRPIDSAFDGGRLAVAVPADLEVAPSPDESIEGEAGGAVVPAESPPSMELGPWSRSTSELTRRALWLRFEAPADAVSLVLSDRPSTVSSMIDQLVRVGRDGIDVQQDLTLFAPDGELTRVDLAIPPALERSWELVDRGVVDQEEPIPPGPDGMAIRRLTLAQPSSRGSVKLRLRYRVLGVGRLEPGQDVSIEIPRIEVLDPRPGAPPRVEVAADPGIALTPEGEGWRRPAENQWVTNPDGGSPLPIRQVWVRPAGSAPESRPRLSASAASPALVPEALASRLWLRTEKGTDGGVRTSAWFRFDDHGPSLGFRLPSGADLDRVYLDGEPVPSDDLDALDRPGAFLLHLPAESARGVVVGLSYRFPQDASSSRWEPPRLLDGGRILETIWEVRVPWNQALIGVPQGFLDENVWYWAGYVWKRRPGMSASELASWVGGPGASTESLAPPLTGGRVGDHGYLFSRPGDPGPMGSAIVSRALLVGGASGVVLLFGLLLLVRHPLRARVLPVAGLIGVLGLIAVGPSSAIVALQSSAVGWLLLAVAVMTRRVVDHRRPAPRFAERSDLGGGSASGGNGLSGSGGSTPLVGSDDSTAIRPRPQPLDAPLHAPAPSGARSEPGRPDDVSDLAPSRADREAS